MPAQTVDASFADRAGERAVFDALLARLSGRRPIEVEALGVGIMLRRARTFAELQPVVWASS